MIFGEWDAAAHEDSEQQKRIATAKKSEVTPASVDFENSTATYKGSGKNHYITTLDSCTCVDFMRRKLPCKHIYRLAYELNVVSTEFESGMNKNTISEDIFSLPVETQEILYEICYLNIYHKQHFFAFPRNEYSESLLLKGFCVESVVSSSVLDRFPASTIKDILFSSQLDNLPKRSSQKKTFVKWVADNEDIEIPAIAASTIFLELAPQTDAYKSTIHRRYSKKFIRKTIDYGDGIVFEEVTKVFSQE